MSVEQSRSSPFPPAATEITSPATNHARITSVASRASSHAPGHTSAPPDPQVLGSTARTPSKSPPVVVMAQVQPPDCVQLRVKQEGAQRSPSPVNLTLSTDSRLASADASAVVTHSDDVDMEAMLIDRAILVEEAGEADAEGEEEVPETAKMPKIVGHNSSTDSYSQAMASGGEDSVLTSPVTEWPGLSTHKSITSSNAAPFTLGKPTSWSLQTAFTAALPGSEPNTQPPSTVTDSPSSFTSGVWPSTTDFGSHPSRKGYSLDCSTTSSESGWDAGSLVPTRAGIEVGDIDADAEGEKENEGVPPPKAKKSHARKQPEGHIKRARNAFILFRKHITDSNLIPTSVEVKHQNISVVVAKMWKTAPQEVRAKFQEQARIEKEEHQRKYPGYRYQPVFRRTDIIRRRVRKDPAEDEKVDAVAEALIKGKVGDTLEKEIKEQLVSRSSEASESDAESSSRGSRRRRRETGQLSKGALRAQRAQARAKQMRQNLLGSNLLNMSLYNAAQSRLATGYGAHHAHALAHAHAHPHAHAPVHGHPGMQYAMAENYLPVGYDLEGRPIPGMPYQAQAAEMYATGNGNGIGVGQVHDTTDMYRLPPIEGMMDMNNVQGGYEGWQTQQGGAEYWDAAAGVFRTEGVEQGYGSLTEAHLPVAAGGEYYAQAGAYEIGGTLPEGNGMEYRLPPLLEASREGVTTHSDFSMDRGMHAEDERGEDPRMGEWTRDGQQTPSGHVMFNERLFDGALGSANLPERREGDEGLGGIFDQGLETSDTPPW